MSSTSEAPAQPLTTWLAARGFYVPTLVFALRTALAAFAALAIAYALGLEHPHWAAMSAWAASQPMREHLLSRGIYRFAGSVVGVAYAVLLVLVAQDSLWVLAVGLSLWGGACAFLGNLQRGYMVYGCMLAGYSAAMVVLLHHGPAVGVWALAGDRMLTVTTGVMSALCISWCFAPRRDALLLISQSRQALAQVLQAAVAQLRRQPEPEGLGAAGLQAGLARVEGLLDLYREGSRTARQTTTALHWQQHQAMELVYCLAQAQERTVPGAAGEQEAPAAPAPDGDAGTALPAALDALCRALRQPPAASLAPALREAIRTCEAAVQQFRDARAKVPIVLNALYLLLQEMRRAEHAEQSDLPRDARVPRPAAHRTEQRADPLPLHRDWVGARQAAIRAGGTLLVFGALWAATGWRLVAFGMLGLSVMLLVFSAFENPHRTVAYVLRGQVIGAALALACQWLVWPWVHSGWAMVWTLLPFVLLAALAFAHKRTAAGGMDINMAMFILLAPVFPYTVNIGASLSMALAVVSGPALAWLVYRGIYPTNALHRMRTLAQMMVAEVPALAQRMVHEGKPSLQPAMPAGFWQARLHHRMLRLARWSEKTHHDSGQQLAQMGLALRFMQSAMLELQQWRRDTVLATPGLRRAERQAELALRRTARWGQARPQTDAGAKAAAQAWQALSAQQDLPSALAAQARHIAQRDLPVLDSARRALAQR